MEGNANRKDGSGILTASPWHSVNVAWITREEASSEGWWWWWQHRLILEIHLCGGQGERVCTLTTTSFPVTPTHIGVPFIWLAVQEGKDSVRMAVAVSSP
jgi:hypothetical protein